MSNTASTPNATELRTLNVLASLGQATSTKVALMLRTSHNAADTRLNVCVVRGWVVTAPRLSPYTPPTYSLTEAGYEARETQIL